MLKITTLTYGMILALIMERKGNENSFPVPNPLPDALQTLYHFILRTGACGGHQRALLLIHTQNPS